MPKLSAAFESLAPRKPGAPAVILFSGGLDSTTVLALAKDLGYAPYALSVGYGQRHSSELAAAKHIAKQIGVVRHEVVNLDLTRFGGSALTDSSIAVPTTPGVAADTSASRTCEGVSAGLVSRRRT